MSRLKALREKKGLTQEILAKMAGIDPRTINRIEKDIKYIASGKTIKTLAKTLNTTASYILGETDDPAPPHMIGKHLYSKSDVDEVCEPPHEYSLQPYVVYATNERPGGGKTSFEHLTFEGHITYRAKEPVQWAMRIHGDSMEHLEINDGALLFIQPLPPGGIIHKREIAVCVFPDTVSDWQVRQVFFHPHNNEKWVILSSKYGDIEYREKQVQFAGKVIEWVNEKDKIEEILARIKKD